MILEGISETVSEGTAGLAELRGFLMLLRSFVTGNRLSPGRPAGKAL